MDLQKVETLVDHLRQHETARKISRGAMMALAMGVSLVPIAGGPASIAVDKLGEALFAPDNAARLAAFDAKLKGLEGELESSEALAETVRQLVVGQTELREDLQAMISFAATESLDPFTLKNAGGINNLTRVLIEKMALYSVVSEGGVTSLHNVEQIGTATFETNSGAHNIENSRFSGRSGGVAGFSSITQATAESGTLEFNKVSEDGTFAATRMTVVADKPGEGVIGMSITTGQPPRFGVKVPRKT